MSDAHANVSNHIIGQRSSVNQQAHPCARRQRKAPNFWSSTLEGIKSTAFPAIGQSGRSESGSIAPPVAQGQQTTSAGYIPQASASQQTPKLHGAVTSQQQAPQIGIRMPDPSRAFVFFGVKGSRRSMELAQIDTSQVSDDSLFFASMKREYKTLRAGVEILAVNLASKPLRFCQSECLNALTTTFANRR